MLAAIQDEQRPPVPEVGHHPIGRTRAGVLQSQGRHHGTRDRRRLLANLGVELGWERDHRRRSALSDQALALARDCGDPATLAHVLLARPQTLISAATTLAERLAASAELMSMSETVADPVVRCWAHCLRAATLLEAGDLAGLDEHLGKFERAAMGLGQPVLRWRRGCSIVSRHTLAGRLAEADAQAADALAIGRDSGQPDADAHFSGQMFAIRFHQGRMADLADLPGWAGQVWPTYYASNVAGWRAAWHAELGQAEEARESMSHGAAVEFRISQDVTWLVSLTWYASAAAALGDGAAATALYDLLYPYRDQMGVTGALTGGAVSHWLGLLAATTGRTGLADRHFAAAADLHERMASPPWLARTELEWGQTLLTSGRPDDAPRGRDLLRRALATARAHGLQTIDRRASALLRRDAEPAPPANRNPSFPPHAFRNEDS